MAWIRSNKKGSTPTTAESFIYNVGQVAFNTGYTHTANTKIRFKGVLESWINASEWLIAFGAMNGNFRSNSFIFWSKENNTKMGYSRTNNYVLGDSADAAESSTSANWVFTPCIFTAEGQTISWYKEVDPNTVRSLTSSGTVDAGIAPLAIFNANNSTTPGGWNINVYATAFMKLFWFEIYENDTLLHRFVPAYNNNQYCLYDEVDETYIYDVVNNGANLRGFIAS